jgi:hypothetical protein
MPLKGSAFLALWNDIEPQRRTEYDAWHTFEHVPERVGIPGFIRGRRYVARERSEQRYFTLYELGGLEALEGVDYVDVVERPTDWSASMRPSFRNVIRHPCTTVVSLGQGVSGSISTLRFGIASTGQKVDVDTARAVLGPLLETAQITAAHFGQEVAKAPLPSMERLGWGQATENTMQHVLMIEGLDRQELEAAQPRLAELVRQQLNAIGDIAFVAFDLAFIVEKSGLPGPTTSRQPARRDLQT